MNCEDTQNQLYDYLDGELSEPTLVELETHLGICDACQEIVNEEHSLRKLLSELPVEPVREGFIERALLNAEQQPASSGQVVHNKQRQGFFLGFGTAAVAALALWLIVGILPSDRLPNGAQQEGFKEIQIALHETRDLKLAFYSKQVRKGAMISIQLPSNVELDGFPEKRNLVWSANLTEGDNLLILPIKALAVSSSELIAKIEYGEQTKTLKVRLRTTEPGMTQLHKSTVAMS